MGSPGSTEGTSDGGGGHRSACTHDDKASTVVANSYLRVWPESPH